MTGDKTHKENAAMTSPPSEISGSVVHRRTGEFPKDVRSWLSGLSIEERVAALGFNDELLVSLISKLAAASSKRSPLSTTGEIFDETTDGRKDDKIEWQAKITFADFEKAYAEVVNNGSSAKSDGSAADTQPDEDNSEPPINANADTIDQDNNVLNRDVGSSETGSEANQPKVEDSDDIRIHHSEAKTSGSVSSIVSDDARDNDAKEDDSRVENGSTQIHPAPPDNNADRIPTKLYELLDNCCFVVPSALQLTAGKVSKGSLPFITFRPSYLRKIGDALLDALDECNFIFHLNSFSFFNSPARAAWIDLVHDIYKHKSTDSKPLDLCSLLILRFHISLFNAYNAAATNHAEKERPTSTGHEKTTETGDETSPNKNAQDPSSETAAEPTSTEPGAVPEPEEAHDPAETDDKAEANNASASGRTSPTKETLSLLAGNLVKHLDGLPHPSLAGVDGVLETFKTKVPEAAQFVVQKEDIIWLPFGLLLHKMQGSNLDVDKVILEINAAVGASLEASSGLSAAYTPVATDGAENEEKPADPTQQNEHSTASSDIPEVPADTSVSHATQAGGGLGKRSKKKKKKKKRKGSAGNLPVNAKDAVMQDKPNTPESEKTEAKNPDIRVQSAADITLAKAQEAVDNCAAILDKTTPPSSPVKENPTVIAGPKMETLKIGESEAENNSDVTPVTSNEQGEKSDTAPKDAEAKNADQNKDNDKGTGVEEAPHEDDYSAWETVEVRSRGNRKKSTDRNSHGRFGSHHGHNNSNQHGSKKSKAPRTKDSRKRTANRKMVREILAGVLDTVDEEVRRRRQSPREVPRFSGSKWPSAAVRNQLKGMGGASTAGEAGKSGSQATMRDVLIGRQSNNSAKGSANMSSASGKKGSADRPRGKAGGSRFGFDNKRNRDKSDRASLLLGGKPSGTPTADQNTATTVPETVSANSALMEATNTRTTPVRGATITRSDSSSGESAEEVKEKGAAPEAVKEASPSPPLPTLLSPGNNNSASSSVASSLEAPHAVHNVNQYSSFLGNENDVGYHLLHVCDRLTRDIQIFMKRREYALEIRRRERGMVLEALQESLSTIWPGMCSVEMYGSCATELDLPSSDLDVVVCGLDRPVEKQPNSSSRLPKQNSSDRSTDGKSPGMVPSDSGRVPGDSQQPIHGGRHPPHHPQMPMMYGHLSLNAERVVRLAMELELRPWAVHVKAIPTASVPVIKILADPTRLNGALRNDTGEWLVQQAATGQPSNADSSGSNLEAPTGNNTSISGFHSTQSPPPWRGADVVNGLMKVDITFEGPEHGGIGSTKFSARVVQEFSQENNLPADQTPEVQVLMVLKELLAQRRLNEPFSGGLSSYALLLLVISVVRERAIIKEELERVERQRRIVAAGGGNSTLRADHAEFIPNAKFQETLAKAAANRTNHGDGRETAEQAEYLANGDTNKKSSGSGRQSEEPSWATSNKAKEPAKQVGAVANATGTHQKHTNANKGRNHEPEKQQQPGAGKKQPGKPSSWASIAKKSAAGPADRRGNQETPKPNNSTKKATQQNKPKVNSFADAVAKGTPAAAVASGAAAGQNTKKAGYDDKKNRPKRPGNPQAAAGQRPQTEPEAVSSPSPAAAAKAPSASPNAQSQQRQHTPSYNQDAGSSGPGPLFPQGFHDVTEVLCSGETTPGKLLMNFLLFYGQHFDSQSTAIDYSLTHQREGNNNGYSHFSPYLQRRSGGSYDPMTGMLTVDPIVVYDPLEGAENNNVARSCFAWSSIRWVFAQSYMTLSSVVEMSASNTSGQIGPNQGKSSALRDANGRALTPGVAEAWSGPYIHDDSGNVMVDPSSSLLELLLAF